MNRPDTFDRGLAAWLEEQAGPGAPTYLDEVLARTTHTRQRPAWAPTSDSFSLRWTADPRWTGRLAAALVVLGLLLALGAAAIYIGSRANEPTPPPFGPASNGAILFSGDDGDIHRLDPDTGIVAPVITGPDTDRFPYLSRDGRLVVFDRQAPGSDAIVTMLANADGSDVRLLTDRVSDLQWIEWSPDSSELAIVADVDGRAGLWILGLDGSLRLVLPEEPGTAFERIDAPTWRPNGHELVLQGGRTGDQSTPPTSGLYVVDVEATDAVPRAIVGPSADLPAHHDLSPDGTKVAYRMWAVDHGEIHVVDVATSVDRVVDFDGTPNDQFPRWSPDGSMLLFEHFVGGFFHLAVGSPEGGTFREIGPGRTGTADGTTEARFSPDGRRVLAYYYSDGTSWFLDPTGVAEDVPFGAVTSTPPSWQRVAEGS
jgi:WD40 repeat protein